MRIKQDGLENVWFSAYSREMPWWHHSHWWLHRRSRKRFMNSWTTMLQDEEWGFCPTTSCCTLRRKRRLWWQLVVPFFFIDLLLNLSGLMSSVYLGARPEMQTEHLTVLLFGIRTQMASEVFSLLLKCWENLRTETSIFPSGKKRFVTRSDWSPSSDMRRVA